MNLLKRYVSALILMLGMNTAFAQDFKSDLKKLNTEIEVAYKSQKITEPEYQNLKKEQDIIQSAIEKAGTDKVLTQDEKNKIYSKIIRSRKRLVKYKNQSEAK
ncbi:hypothetical protein [Dyadobacter sp. NIV53]|uniref:hypothetical protein n=1 Tax=Dyadobacter sp. NIV53 TaxID=2861765 RepID=UPI001C875C84|nr:hypothetical protein [Dyadobacter sp. NIV53]